MTAKQNRNAGRGAQQDPVDTALEQLAAAHGLDLPDPRLERRLVDLALAPPRRSWMRRGLRLAAGFALIASLAGGALAATVGIEGLKRWWYSIQVGAERIHGTLDGPGRRNFEFTTDDGLNVQVTIERGRESAHAQRTRVAIREQGVGTQAEELYERVESPAGAESSPEPRVDSKALVGAQALHTWTNARGLRKTLYLVDGPGLPGGAAGWLATHELDSGREPSVLLVQPIARRISVGAAIEVTEHTDGSLEVELDDGHGWAIALILDGSRAETSPQVQALTTSSGRVRVELGSE